MKKFNLITAIVLVSLSTCFAFSLTGKKDGETHVSFKESKTSYTLSASFNNELTPKVRHFLDSCLDAEQTQFPVKDRAVFHHELSAGELDIKAEKKDNSTMALARIKKICQDLRYVIVPR